ncbi:MAG: hypothetical protein V9F06_09640 [Thermomicrobiales bacterium]
MIADVVTGKLDVRGIELSEGDAAWDEDDELDEPDDGDETLDDAEGEGGFE